MARSGTFNFQDFEKIKNNLEKLNQEQVDLFIDACAKDLQQDFLQKSSKGHLLVIIQTVQGKKVAHFAGVGLVERIQVLLLMLIH